MRAKIEIEMVNSAFDNPARAEEVGRILSETATRILAPGSEERIMIETDRKDTIWLKDINGNRVGTLRVEKN